MNRNGLVYTVIFTFITAFFFVFFLSLANSATGELVKQNQKAALQSAVLRSLGIDFTNPAEAFNERFSELPVPGKTLSRTVDGEAVLIRYFSGSGLWGTITGILAVDDQAERIIGLDIISHNETPGLGGRIDESWFKEQFRGEKIPADGITIRKGSGNADNDSENGMVDGVTGASLTSSSMESIVNDAVSAIKGDA